MIRKQTALWKTRDGSKIRICDMSDTHLINATRWLMKYANWKKGKMDEDMAVNPFHGDMAVYFFEQEQNRIWNTPCEHYLPEIYYKLESEAERRGLELNGQNTD